jgi:predicted dehydrogenase
LLGTSINITNANPRIAIVGCGAVVEQRYAPTLKRLKLEPAAIFDTLAERRRSVGMLFGTRPVEAERASAALDAFDAAIVAVPHALHESLCVELLCAGKHVLVEKPMALTAISCRAMNRAADESDTKIAVALMRRQAHGGRWLKEAIDAQVFGRLDRFTIREGYPGGWPFATDSMWRKEQAGGGVLFDTGSHTFDQIVWWFGMPNAVEYFDDADNGVEANCLVRMGWSSGLKGEIELTRTRLLSNLLKLETEKGVLSLPMNGNAPTGSREMLGYRATKVGAPPFKPGGWSEFFRDQLEQFLAYVSGKPANVVTGKEAVQSIELIERCYAVRQRLEKPWIHYTERKHG